MAGEQVSKDKLSRKQVEEEVAPEVGKVAVTEGLAEDIDNILDDIDSVLEENAEEFVRGYVQKGGQ